MHIYEHFHSPFSPRFQIEFGKIFQFSSNLIRAQRSLTHLREREREGLRLSRELSWVLAPPSVCHLFHFVSITN